MRPLENAAEIALASAISLCGQPGFEAALFDMLVRVTGADNLVILAFPRDGAPQLLFQAAAVPDVFAQLGTAYLDGAYLLDPIYALQAAQAPAGVYRLADVAPDAFARSRYYQEYYRQTTILDELALLCYPRADLGLTLCLGRDAQSGSVFPARALEAARHLAPVVLALARRHWAGLAGPKPGAGDALARMLLALRERRGIALSPRQAEVALLILRGHSTASIADRLGLSPLTVKVFRRQIYARCAISSQAELFALLTSLIGPGSG